MYAIMFRKPSNQHNRLDNYDLLCLCSHDYKIKNFKKNINIY